MAFLFVNAMKKKIYKGEAVAVGTYDELYPQYSNYLSHPEQQQDKDKDKDENDNENEISENDIVLTNNDGNKSDNDNKENETENKEDENTEKTMEKTKEKQQQQQTMGETNETNDSNNNKDDDDNDNEEPMEIIPLKRKESTKNENEMISIQYFNRIQTERGKLLIKEDRVVGSVAWSVYGKYFGYATKELNISKSGLGVEEKSSLWGWLLCFSVMILFMLTQTAQSSYVFYFIFLCVFFFVFFCFFCFCIDYTVILCEVRKTKRKKKMFFWFCMVFTHFN